MDASWSNINSADEYVFNTLEVELPDFEQWQLKRAKWKIERIDLEQLTFDHEIINEYQNSKIFRASIHHFVNVIQTGMPIPPLITVGRNKFLLDGYARLLALKQCEIDHAKAAIQLFETEYDDPKEFLGQSVYLIFDRPLGTTHPRFGFNYELNYGFVPGTHSPDLEELDAYFIGINEPLHNTHGKCIAIVNRLDDNDDKLIVVPNQYYDLSDEQIEKAVYFQEKWFRHRLMR